MHVLFVHQNFPAQFGHIASHLAQREGFECTFVSMLSPGNVGGVRRIQYKTDSGATKSTHFCSRTFENAIWHADAVYKTMKSHRDIRPDLVVGHSGFGSTLFLADLYDCPIINYFEYFYRGHNSDLDFRPEFPAEENVVLRARSRNAMILLDLENCAGGYAPTEWQRSLFPRAYQDKLETIFDGIDTQLWQRQSVPRKIGDREFSPQTRIVTYVARGFESMRGFDIFMKVAKRICDARSDVIFVCVGTDRICYGGDLRHIKQDSFRKHVLAGDDYDLERFIFTGQMKPQQLADILSLSDLHIYLTVPFVLSWSMMNALACGCTVLGSATPPVQEMIRHEENGLLADFYDVDGFTEQALKVLDDPESYRPLGEAGARMIREQYSLEQTIPKLLALYQRAAG